MSDAADEFLAERNKRAAGLPNPLAPASKKREVDDRSETERIVDESVEAGRTGQEIADDFVAKRNATGAAKPNALRDGKS